jgi:Mg2+/Co2+ transporter CorC
MEDYVRKLIYDTLNLRETEDLLEIWQAANTDEYAEETFDIIREILLEQLGTLPAQSVQFQAISRNPEIWFVSLPNPANTC